jgi:hypothetical protein
LQAHQGHRGLQGRRDLLARKARWGYKAQRATTEQMAHAGLRVLMVRQVQLVLWALPARRAHKDRKDSKATPVMLGPSELLANRVHLALRAVH